MLKLTNTLSGKIEDFKPIGKVVTMYTCGPTAYDFAHIGNLRACIFYDLVRRTLKYLGFKIKHVMNITDVDDKTIAGSKTANLGLIEYTSYYTSAFREDLAALNIEEPEIWAKATEHIKEMVELIKKLLKKGFAYKAKDGIYFDISKFPNYGKLSKQKLNELKTGARVAVDTYDKEDSGDFVLWKFWKEEDGEVYWETEIGKGRPGWHIECSAMSIKYLGQPFDLHLGGEDLIFPHHENEIAQAEAAYDKPFANYFMHNGMVLVEGKKMSKSLGNFYTLRDILEKNYPAMAFRLLCLMSHYRAPLNFKFSEMTAATETLETLSDFIWRLKNLKKAGNQSAQSLKLIETTRENFRSSLENDFNSAKALAIVFDLISAVNKLLDNDKLNISDAEALLLFIDEVDKVLGIFKRLQKTPPPEVQKLIREREKARKKRDWEKSDELRRQIEKMGWQVKDTPYGTSATRF